MLVLEPGHIFRYLLLDSLKRLRLTRISQFRNIGLGIALIGTLKRIGKWNVSILTLLMTINYRVRYIVSSLAATGVTTEDITGLRVIPRPHIELDHIIDEKQSHVDDHPSW